MKAEPIIHEIENVKDRLSEQAGDLTQFLGEMDAWLEKHPHVGLVVNSPEELGARLRHREATEKLLPPSEPYRVYDPIIAEIHRTREKLYQERQKHAESGCVGSQVGPEETAYSLREEPRKKEKNK